MFHHALATVACFLTVSAGPEKPPRASADQVKMILARTSATAQRYARTPRPMDGDAVLDGLIQAAAAEAERLPADVQADALLVALAVGLDPGNTLATNPVTRGALGGGFGGHETPAQVAVRREALSKCTPKMRGRTDWVLHWALSAGLAARLGADEAKTFGITKEAMDMNGPSGWSWTDLNADLSGIEFARRLRSGQITLKQIKEGFKSTDALADPQGLEDKVTAEAFRKKYRAVGSPEVRTELQIIEGRVKTHFDRVFGSRDR